MCLLLWDPVPWKAHWPSWTRAVEAGLSCPAGQGICHYPAQDLLCLVGTLDTQGLLIKKQTHFLKVTMNLLGFPGVGGDHRKQIWQLKVSGESSRNIPERKRGWGGGYGTRGPGAGLAVWPGSWVTAHYWSESCPAGEGWNGTTSSLRYYTPPHLTLTPKLAAWV